MTLLHRINRAKNEARFYLIEVGADLFTPWTVKRVWGRLGGAQQQKITPCASEDEARRIAARLVRECDQAGRRRSPPPSMAGSPSLATPFGAPEGVRNHRLFDRQPAHTPETRHCAGAALVLSKMGQPNSLMQVAERLGCGQKLRGAELVFDSLAEFVWAYGGRKWKAPWRRSN